jgi:PEP-CTERM motif
MKRLLVLSLLAAAGASQAAAIYNNGPVVPTPGGFSVLTAPRTTFGFGDQTASGNAVADDFVVPAGATWNISSIDFYGYQTGAVGFTFQQATWSVLAGDANTGTVIASGVTTVTNGGLVGYRSQTAAPTDTTRAIYSVQTDMPDFSLTGGTYWLRWSLTGSAASGPWQPPTSDNSVGNARQLTSTSGGLYTTLVETGSGLTPTLPFALNGTITNPVPEPGTWAMMLAGAAGVLTMARRRRAAV